MPAKPCAVIGTRVIYSGEEREVASIITNCAASIAGGKTSDEWLLLRG
jgi:hypothetical protein